MLTCTELRRLAKTQGPDQEMNNIMLSIINTVKSCDILRDRCPNQIAKDHWIADWHEKQMQFLEATIEGASAGHDHPATGLPQPRLLINAATGLPQPR